MNIIQDNILIKRSSKQHIDNLLNQNPDWKVLDIGCGYTAHKKATVVCDIFDLSAFYQNKKLKFVRVPKFDEVPYPIVMEPNLVIEYYSR